MNKQYIMKQIAKLEHNNKVIAAMGINHVSIQHNVDTNNKLIASYKKDLAK